METVIGLLLMLLRASQGVETNCDGRQDGVQCYGPLEGTVVLQLRDSFSGISRYRWLRDAAVLIDGGEGRALINNIGNRAIITPSNGTFRISNLSRSDGGQYTFFVIDSNGRQSEQRTFNLTIQAPVSSVLLVSECLSQGEMRVSCSSVGEGSLQYRWTLGGQTLTDAQLLSGNSETNNITLKQDVSGDLVCSVRNDVSSVMKAETISTCGFIFIDCISNGTQISQWVYEANNTLCIDTTTTSPKSTEEYLPAIAAVLTALLVFLAVGMVIICGHKKKQKSKQTAEEDEQELTYADVNIVRQQQRQVKQRVEEEVEYDQVKFSARPQSTAGRTGDDVYAMVRQNR